MIIRSVLVICILSFGFFGNAVADISSGLVAHYKFDGNANDSSGNGYNAIESGGVSYVSGKYAQATSFDGDNGKYIYTTLNPLTGIGTSDFTISVWTKFNKVTDNWIYFLGENLYGGEEGIRALISNDSTVKIQITDLTTGSSNSSTIVSSTVLSTDTWYHIVMSRNNSVAYLYVNAVLNGSISSIQSLTSNEFSNSITVGVRPTNWNYPFNGQIDELKIYNRALSESEIQELYTGETSCTSAEAGTVSSSLDIHMPSLNYETLFGTQNIWADLEYLGINSDGQHTWGLKDYGAN